MSTIRENIQGALAEVYSGATDSEVNALIDKLADRGLVIMRAADLDEWAGIDEDREMPPTDYRES
jgi:hypothetical protein